MYPYWNDDDPQDTVSKSELRALASVALANWHKPINRLPTVHSLRCICGHRAKVSVPANVEKPKFRCKKCGARCF